MCSYITNIPDENGQNLQTRVNPNVNVMDLLNFSEEYDIFTTQPVLDLIEFKWENIGFKFHLIGFCNHIVFTVLIFLYNIDVYINDSLYEFVETDDPNFLHGLERVPKSGNIHNQGNYNAYILLIGLIYPAVYFFILISKIGPSKLITDPHRLDARVYSYIIYLLTSILTVLF